MWLKICTSTYSIFNPLREQTNNNNDLNHIFNSDLNLIGYNFSYTVLLHFKSRLQKWHDSGFAAKGEIVFEDLSEGVISEAIYEWAQTLGENDKT